MNKEAMKVPIGAVRGTQKQRRNEPDTMPNLSSRIHDSGKSSKTRQAACKYCGGFQTPRQCPAYGKTCSACHKRNHLAKVCLQSARQIRQVEFQVEDAYEEGSDENEELLMSPIFIAHIRDTAEWTERLDLERAQIDFKLDTGAQANVLPFKVYRVLKTKLQPTSKIPTGIGGGQIIPRGTTQVSCLVSRKKGSCRNRLTFYVIDDNLAILGRAACEDLDLIRRVDNVVPVDIQAGHTRQQLIEQNKDVFKGIGEYDKEYDIKLQADAIPVVQHPRVIPYAKRTKLQQTLAKLQQQGIIQDVEGPTDWLHNLVIAERRMGT